MLCLEVGVDISREGESADVVLYSEFESREALATYQNHPAHAEVAPLVKALRSAEASPVVEELDRVVTALENLVGA